MNAVRQVFGKSTGVQCPIAVTDIPRDVFSSSKMNIHSHFCEGWLKDTRKTMTVNSTGGNVLPEPHKKAVTKRTPPADPASYSSFRFDLSYEPNGKGEGACKQDCNAAFSQLANSCAFSSRKFPASAPPPKLQTTQSLTPFQAGIYMYEKGAYDVDCGKFEYKISKSNEPPIQEVADFIEYNRYCYKPEEPPPLNGDVNNLAITTSTPWPCELGGAKRPDYTIKKDDKSTLHPAHQVER